MAQKGGQPRCAEEDCGGTEPRGREGRWSGNFQPFHGRGFVRFPPERCFPLGSRVPLGPRAGRSCPALPLPEAALGRGHTGQPTRLLPALLAGRWHPPSAQSTAGSGEGPAARRGTGQTPRPRGRRGPTRGEAAQGCAAAARPPPFLSCPFEKAPAGLGRERADDAQRQVSISRGCNRPRS